MTIWIVFALMTVAAVVAVLWPLSRQGRTRPQAVDQAAFYRAQLAEIDRDLGRGLLQPADAEAARTEAGRRLIRAGSQSDPSDGDSEPSLRRRRAASALAVSTIPLIAIAVYGALGSPGLPTQPLTAQQSPAGPRIDMGQAVAQVEAHLAKDPSDGRGWDLLAPIYLKSGRPADAARAYQNALRLLGETPARLADLAEALVGAAHGVVEQDARALFERALVRDPTSAKAKFYLALAAEQDGDKDGAVRRLRELVAGSPAGAPWLPLVEAKLNLLTQDAATAAIANLPPDDQKAAILGMVESLAARLKQDGNDPAGWLRLVRSYAVLGERAKANEALATGRQALAGRPDGVAQLDALGREFGLDGAGAKP